MSLKAVETKTGQWQVVNDSGNLWATVKQGGIVTEKTKACRIAECINACVGVADPEATKMADLKLKAADRDGWQQVALRVSAERDKLLAENATLRAAQKACEGCDAPTMAEVEALRRQCALLRQKNADAEKMLDRITHPAHED